MKGKLPIQKIITHIIGENFPDSLQHLLPRMQEIYQNLFNAGDGFDFSKLLKHRGGSVALRLFYGEDMELAGFAIAGIQTANIDKHIYAVFSAGVYSDLKYNIGQKLARFALVQSIKYKICHPRHRLAYLAEALTPAPYSFSAKILPEYYPHPSLKTPEYVASIIQAIGRERNFTIKKDSRFVVNSRVITKYPEKFLSSSKLAHCKYYQYYLTINPDFQSGNALLIYMPLTLKNILIGLKNHMKWCLKK